MSDADPLDKMSQCRQPERNHLFDSLHGEVDAPDYSVSLNLQDGGSFNDCRLLVTTTLALQMRFLVP